MPLTRRLRTGAAVVIAIAALSAVGWSSAASGASSGGLGSSYNIAGAGKATITLWWLGNQEIPGIQTWMTQAIASFTIGIPVSALSARSFSTTLNA